MSTVTESEFYMWRAVFAFAMIDRLMTVEKRHFLLKAMQHCVLSQAQKQSLSDDLENPKDIEWLFVRIKKYADRYRFCKLARQLLDLTHFDNAHEEAKTVLEHLERLASHDGRLFATANGKAKIACQKYQETPLKTAVIYQFTNTPTIEVLA